MRIHSDTLTYKDIFEAVKARGMTGVDVDAERHGSRSRAHSFDVHLTGNSPYRPNMRDYASDEYAATWDEWGMFLATLFEKDPRMTVPRVYPSSVLFHFATCGRFYTLTAPFQHRRHKWEYSNGLLQCDCGAARDRIDTRERAA